MGYCATCNNTEQVDCYRGGDLCICENYGETDCPDCGGMGPWFDDDDVEAPPASTEEG